MKSIENAKVRDVFFGIEDHGCLTLTIFLEGPWWGCGYGGYQLGGKCNYNSCAEVIMEILETFNIRQLYDLKGKYVRAEFTSEFGGSINRIGDILEDKWFSFKEFFDKKNLEMQG